MPITVISHLMLLVVGFTLCFTNIRSPRSRSLATIVTGILFAAYFVIARQEGLHNDILNYSKAMDSNSLSMYYLKEPFFWLGSRFLKTALNDSQLVFFIFDLFSIFLILFASTRLQLPAYFPYLFLLSFPITMGVFNIYRQYLACCFLLWHCSCCIKQEKIVFSYFWLAAATLTHNAAFLFQNLLPLSRKNRVYHTVFALVALINLSLIPIAAKYKSFSYTGVSSPVDYIIFLAILAVLFFFSSTKNLRYRYMPFFVYMIVLVITVNAFSGTAQTKRIAMMSISVSLPFLATAIEGANGSIKSYRIALYLLTTLPTLIFGNSLSLIAELN